METLESTPPAAGKPALALADAFGAEEAGALTEGAIDTSGWSFGQPLQVALRSYAEHPGYWILLASCGAIMSLHWMLMLVGVLMAPALMVLNLGGAHDALAHPGQPLTFGGVWSRWGDRLGPAVLVALVGPLLFGFGFCVVYGAGLGVMMLTAVLLKAGGLTSGVGMLLLPVEGIAFLVVVAYLFFRSLRAWLFASQAAILGRRPMREAFAESGALIQGSRGGAWGFLALLTVLSVASSGCLRGVAAAGYQLLFHAAPPIRLSLSLAASPFVYMLVTSLASGVVATWWGTAWTYRYLQERGSQGLLEIPAAAPTARLEASPVSSSA